MPLDIHLGDSVDNGVGSYHVDPHNLKRSAWKVVQDDGSLVKVTNVLAPLDKPMTLKITNTRIANVYNTLAKGSIPLGNQSTNTSGQSIFVELSTIASKVQDAQTVLVPVVARVELRLPNDGDLSEHNCIELIRLALGAFVNPNGTPGITASMRGVLFPE